MKPAFVACCENFRKEFPTREAAERWIARVEEIGACDLPHTIEAPSATCDRCGKEITEVYEVPVERYGVLHFLHVGRDCMKQLAAEGWDNAERVR